MKFEDIVECNFSDDGKLFDLIAEYYHLNTAIKYYKLFNESKYKNSYHGWMHVKNKLCALHLCSIQYKLPYNLTRLCMIAAIFHDYNYAGIEKDNPDYDAKNILNAVEGVEDFCYDHYIYFTSKDDEIRNCENFIIALIYGTQYPNYREDLESMFNVDYREFIDALLKGSKVNDDIRLNPGAFLIELMRECDHSMPLFMNYEFLCYQFLTFEMGSITKEDYYANANDYLDRLNFSFPVFQDYWSKNREAVKEGIIEFIDEVAEFVADSRLINLPYDKIKSAIEYKKGIGTKVMLRNLDWVDYI